MAIFQSLENMLQKPELSAGLMGHLARKQTLPTLPIYEMRVAPQIRFMILPHENNSMQSAIGKSIKSLYFLSSFQCQEFFCLERVYKFYC